MQWQDLMGHGDAFVFRDPNGIRPAYWYEDDEIAVASERPVIQTVFNVPLEDIKEVSPGSTLIIKKNGEVFEKQVLEPKEKKSCSFERIYFSRGSDNDIYKERKELGKLINIKDFKINQSRFKKLCVYLYSKHCGNIFLWNDKRN